MNTKIMEGLAGASTSMNLLNTPMRVYKEARLKGDTATMERAAGYVGDFAGRAEEYKTEAYKGMEEDAREARKRQKKNGWKSGKPGKRQKKNGWKSGKQIIYRMVIQALMGKSLRAQKTALPGQSSL